MDQKAEEKYYLELFKNKINDFPAGDITTSESPDFIIKNKFGEALCARKMGELKMKLNRNGEALVLIKKSYALGKELHHFE